MKTAKWFEVAPIVPFAATFLGTRYDEYAMNSILPFAALDGNKADGSDKYNYWATPDFTASLDPIAAGKAYGRRAAAALVIKTAHQGSESELRRVLQESGFHDALNGKDLRPGQRAAAQYFTSQLLRYLWSLGQLASPAQLAADAEEAIAYENSLNEADLIDGQRRSSLKERSV